MRRAPAITFDGAYLAEYLLTGEPFRAGLYANAAAGLATRGYGAVEPIPRRAEILRHLGEAWSEGIAPSS